MVAPYALVIPAYNAALTIAATIESALAQSVPPQRIIIVDDGSSDDIGRLVGALAGPIALVRQDNTGPGAATTRGLTMIDTPFVATLDADDLWLPGKVALQLAALEADETIAGVFCRVAEFRGTPDHALYDSAYDGWLRTTMVMRTKIARAAGPCVDPPGRGGEMIGWLAQIREAGHRLLMLNDVLALRRIHPGSMSYGRPASLDRSYVQTAREALLRRRDRAGSEPQ